MHTHVVRAALVVLVACCAGISTARAKVVVMEPPVVYQCRQNPTWNDVVGCMAKLGKVTQTRAVAGGKLVQLAGTNAGVYLFAQRAGARGPWTIAGIFQQDHAVVLDFQALTLNQHAGFRIELGAEVDVGIPTDDSGAGAIAAKARETIVMFCGGDNYDCEQAIVTCDARANNKSYAVFRGTLRIDGNEVHIDGDRSRAGTVCQSPDRFFLGWAPNK